MTVSTTVTADEDNVIKIAENVLRKQSEMMQTMNSPQEHLVASLDGERLHVQEWDHSEDENGYRHRNGWRGRDLMHCPRAPVRITDYFVTYGPGTDIQLAQTTTTTIGETEPPPSPSPRRGGAGTVLTGIVVFSAAAESHAGYCHGGSMCSVMDDVVGWIAFCVTGRVRPWTGFTVQVNTSLQKPVAIHSTLIVQATVTRTERRKVYVNARLYDPANDTVVVHATCEGVVVLNKGILAEV